MYELSDYNYQLPDELIAQKIDYERRNQELADLRKDLKKSLERSIELERRLLVIEKQLGIERPQP